jgi:nitroimidazol reductase NimA-like FMN-containing flavoprotein (pyridoxamine 5'-phosphate oxidase superfamily)
MPLPRSMLRMTDEELNELLATERTARIGTAAPDGEPHVAPLWFVWHDGALWFNSLKRSRRSSDVEAGSRAAVCVDAGHEYAELRGAVLYGKFEEAGDVPEVRQLFGNKYFNGIQVPIAKSHRWLVLRPDKIVSWDFKKIPGNADPQSRLAEGR